MVWDISFLPLWQVLSREWIWFGRMTQQNSKNIEQGSNTTNNIKLIFQVTMSCSSVSAAPLVPHSYFCAISKIGKDNLVNKISSSVFRVLLWKRATTSSASKLNLICSEDICKNAKCNKYELVLNSLPYLILFADTSAVKRSQKHRAGKSDDGFRKRFSPAWALLDHLMLKHQKINF